jgi:excisionase family DNA binding protein
MTVQNPVEPILITETDKAALAKIEAIIKNGTNGHSLKLVGADGQEAELPASLSKALQSLVNYLATGQEVNVSLVDKEISIDEAADILHVSNYYITKLLDSGKVSFTKSGEERRLQLGELLEYNRKNPLSTREGLRQR